MGVLLVLLLGGPTPGAVGSCSDNDEVIGAVEWCVEKEGWICERRGAQGTYDDDEVDACLRGVEPSCQGRTWPPDCVPLTRRVAQACIDALGSIDRLGTAEGDLEECKLETLCGGDR